MYAYVLVKYTVGILVRIHAPLNRKGIDYAKYSDRR